MKEIRLLGKAESIYGESFSLKVKTASEMLRAMECNFTGFIKYLEDNSYILMLVDLVNPEESRVITVENKSDLWGNETLFAIPIVDGGLFGLEVPIMAGMASLAGSAGLSVTAGVVLGHIAVAVVGVAASMAVSMAVSAISTAIIGSGTGSSSSTEDSENSPSYLFNGVVNTMKQGGRIPLLYGGPLLVGSMTLSSQISTVDIPV